MTTFMVQTELSLLLWYNFDSIHKTVFFVFFSNTQHTGNNYRFLKHNCYMFMNLPFGKLIVIHIYFRYQSSLSHLHLKLYYFRVRSIRMSKNYSMTQYRYDNISCQRYYNLRSINWPIYFLAGFKRVMFPYAMLIIRLFDVVVSSFWTPKTNMTKS